MTTRKQRSRHQAQQPKPEPEYRPARPLWPVEVTEDTTRLHYRGDCTEYQPNQVYGPDRFGALYRVIDAHYDDEHDRTTLYFHPLTNMKEVLSA